MRSLKTKVAHLISALTLLFLVVYLSIFYLYQQPKLLEQEEMFARKTTLQVRAVLERSLRDLVSLNEDWSNWDAMYRAVDDWTPAFEDEAMPQEVFESLNIDYVGVFNKEHNAVFSKWLVNAPDGDVLVSRTPDERIMTELFKHTDHLVLGIFQTQAGPVFLSCQPIFKSDMTGPERGFLVMGRIIDQRLIEDIGSVIRERMWLLDADTMRGLDRTDGGIAMQRTGLTLFVTFSVKDYFNHDIFAIRVKLERSLYEVLYHSTLVAMGLLLVAVLILIVVVSKGVDRIVLRRILSTANAVHESNLQKLRIQRLPVEGNDEITLLQRAFNRLLRRIENEERVRRQMENEMREIERLATAGRVTGNILHEINNPIRVVKNCLFAIEQRPEKLPESLALMRREIRQLGNLTNQLLDFAGGRDDLELRKMDLVELIRETTTSITTAFPEGNYDIVGPDRAMVAIACGDRNRLKQVFFNVMKNGLEAMGFNGTMGINIVKDIEPGMIVVTILDEGPGVDRESIPHLFEPFYTRHKESGVGLGLSISYDIMKRHGGDIQLDETVRDGACFRIRIPGEMEGDDGKAE